MPSRTITWSGQSGQVLFKDTFKSNLLLIKKITLNYYYYHYYYLLFILIYSLIYLFNCVCVGVCVPAYNIPLYIVSLSSPPRIALLTAGYKGLFFQFVRIKLMLLLLLLLQVYINKQINFV